jgi:hypothetical protein
MGEFNAKEAMRSRSEAVAWIREAEEAFNVTGVNREEECLELATRWGLRAEPIRAFYADTRSNVIEPAAEPKRLKPAEGLKQMFGPKGWPGEVERLTARAEEETTAEEMTGAAVKEGSLEQTGNKAEAGMPPSVPSCESEPVVGKVATVAVPQIRLKGPEPKAEIAPSLKAGFK